MASVTGRGSETLTLRTTKPLVLGTGALRDPLHSGTHLTAVAERSGTLTQALAANGVWCLGHEGACQPLAALNGLDATSCEELACFRELLVAARSGARA